LPDATTSIKGGATILVYYCAQLGCESVKDRLILRGNPSDRGFIADSRKTLIGYFVLMHLSMTGGKQAREHDIMNRLLALAAALFLSVHATTSHAGDTPVVVELFTSQGCSSCPPADEMLARLGERDNVIALALHVDYWDYIGWKDKFAHAAFTKRQKGYARSFGNRSIYTPQMVVNGAEDVVGNRPMDVTDLVQAHATKGLPIPLTLKRNGGTLNISAPAASGMAAADVILIRYSPSEIVSIPRGENAGKKLNYTHVVTEWSDVGDWSGRAPLRTSVQVTGDAPIVVLVQQKGYGPIFAAARLR
jgi:hypothetical protein